MAIALKPLFRKKASKEVVSEVRIPQRDEQAGSGKESPVLKSQKKKKNTIVIRNDGVLGSDIFHIFNPIS